MCDESWLVQARLYSYFFVILEFLLGFQSSPVTTLIAQKIFFFYDSCIDSSLFLFPVSVSSKLYIGSENLGNIFFKILYCAENRKLFILFIFGIFTVCWIYVIQKPRFLRILLILNPNVHGSFTEHMPHECGRIRPQDLWVKLPTPVRDGCQTLWSVGGIIYGRESSIV